MHAHACMACSACGILWLLPSVFLDVLRFYFVLNHCCKFSLFTKPLGLIPEFSKANAVKN